MRGTPGGLLFEESGMNHAQARALERHGINLGPKECRQVAKDIVMGRAILLRRNGHIEEWLVKVREKAIRLVFNPKQCKIITVLPHGRRKQRKARRR